MTTINLPPEMKNAVVLSGDLNDLKNVKVEHSPRPPMMRVSKVEEIGGDQTLMSKVFNNGDFDFRFVIRVTDWRNALDKEYDDKSVPAWNVCLLVVSPQAAGVRECKQALSGFEHDLFVRLKGAGSKKERENRSAFLYTQLAQYGTAARLTDEYGNNLRKLINSARHEAFKAQSVFGFYMDRQQNAYGNTGWDLISGNLANSKDRDHQKYLKSRGITEEQFQDERRIKLESA